MAEASGGQGDPKVFEVRSFFQGCEATVYGALAVDEHDFGFGGVDGEVVLRAEDVEAGEQHLQLCWPRRNEGHIVGEG